MTDVIANLFLDVHQSKAKLSIFLDGNCFVIASTVSVYFLQQMLLSGWLTVTPTRFIMHYMNVVAQGLISPFMECELRQIPAWVSDSRCHGEIQQFESPLLPV